MANQRSRHVLLGVPKVAFAPIHDGKFEFTPLPSCLKSVGRFLGRDLPYHYLLGTSLAAFRLVWHAERWEGGNIDIMVMSRDPLEPVRRALAAAGLSGKILLNSEVSWQFNPEFAALRRPFLEPHLSGDAGELRRRVVNSIDQGIPVIGFGVVGPPEASIVTGYDGAGETLIGWSMFQDHLDPSHDLSADGPDEMHPPSGFEESGYFRRDNWFASTYGIITPAVGPEADVDTVYRSAFLRIPEVLRGPQVYEYCTGTAAFDAYIAKLSDDSEFAGKSIGELVERKMVHYDAMTMIAEHGAGAAFLRDAASRNSFAAAGDLLDRAANLLQEAAAEMESWWEIIGPIWADEEAQIRATASPEVRRAFVPHVEKSRDSCAGAADALDDVIPTLGL